MSWAELEAGGRRYRFQPLTLAGAERLPCSLKVLLENALRFDEDPGPFRAWLAGRPAQEEIRFRPARVLMPDSSGVPLLGDLAAMRDALARLGGDPLALDAQLPVDLVVDHAVAVDEHASAQALVRNLRLEFERNDERYRFLRWAAQAFRNVRLVPPGNGICHQINLEYLASVVCSRDGSPLPLACPDSVLGMDSHTPMVNALGVLGWGVGGLEGGAAALGEGVSLLLPEVVGCRLAGALPAGSGATDLVLAITERLRRHGVVGKFVEYFGPGVESLSLPDRATVANMSPEYGATAGFFPIDGETLRYLRLTGRAEPQVELVEAYAKAQGLWRAAEPKFSEVLEIDLGAVRPGVAGPRRPDQRVALENVPEAFRKSFPPAMPRDGRVVLAAITSCTNTSNPAALFTAGLLARNAVARGLKSKPWVKTSLSPGSRVVADYLAQSGVQGALDALGFQPVGFGCMTCMGNSGPLPADVADAAAAAVLSGNRNFEGRVHPSVRANFLASPALVVAYALAGSVLGNLLEEPLGTDADGKEVKLGELWPDAAEVQRFVERWITPELYRARYASLFEGTPEWRALRIEERPTFAWNPDSTFIRRPPFLDEATADPEPLADLRGARILGMFGDLFTTDHISPVGAISEGTSAARYLQSLGVAPRDFVSYIARRLNHDVMARGTFANVRVRNELTPGVEGGMTRHFPGGELMPIYDAAQRYRAEGVPLVVVAGANYGAGSSRDWAAKGVRLLGVRAVIAESFERIHRSNLVGMGVLPLELPRGATRKTLRLDGSERIDLAGLGELEPRGQVACVVERADGARESLALAARVDTRAELEDFRHGGLLLRVLRQNLKRRPH